VAWELVTRRKMVKKPKKVQVILPLLFSYNADQDFKILSIIGGRTNIINRRLNSSEVCVSRFGGNPGGEEEIRLP